MRIPSVRGGQQFHFTFHAGVQDPTDGALKVLEHAPHRVNDAERDELRDFRAHDERAHEVFVGLVFFDEQIDPPELADHGQNAQARKQHPERIAKAPPHGTIVRKHVVEHNCTKPLAKGHLHGYRDAQDTSEPCFVATNQRTLPYVAPAVVTLCVR